MSVSDTQKEALLLAVCYVLRVLLALFRWLLGLHVSGPTKRVLPTYCWTSPPSLDTRVRESYT